MGIFGYLNQPGPSLSPIQEQAALFALERRKSVVALATGAGKSRVALTVMQHSQQLLKSKYGSTLCTLILCKKNALFNWVAEVKKWSPIPINPVVIDPSLSPGQRQNLYRGLCSNGILIVTHSSVRADFKDFVFPVLKQIDLDLNRKLMLISDESQVTKNPDTMTHQLFKYLGQFASITVATTASVSDNEPEEAYGLLSAVDPQYANSKQAFLDAFINYYRDMQGRIRVVRHDPIRNPAYYSWLFNKVFYNQNSDNIPGVELIEYIISPTQSQQILLDAIKQEPASIFSPNAALARNAHSIAVINEPHKFGLQEQSPKIVELVSIIKRILPEQFLIYCPYKDPLFDIQSLLISMGISTFFIHGGTSSKYRFQANQAFNAGSIQCGLLTDAGADSLNFPTCRHIIFHTMSFSNMSFKQMLGRCRRMTSKFDKVLAHLILCGEPDRHRYKIISEKREAVDLVDQASIQYFGFVS